MHHLRATGINLACFYLLLIVRFTEMTAQLAMFMIYRRLFYAQEIKFIDRHFIHSTFPSSFDSRHTIDIFPILAYFSIRFLWLASFRNYKYIGWPPGSCRKGMQLMFGTISSSVAKAWCITFCFLLRDPPYWTTEAACLSNLRNKLLWQCEFLSLHSSITFMVLFRSHCISLGSLDVGLYASMHRANIDNTVFSRAAASASPALVWTAGLGWVLYTDANQPPQCRICHSTSIHSGAQKAQESGNSN